MSRIRHATETFVNNLIKGVKQLISSNTEQINVLLQRNHLPAKDNRGVVTKPSDYKSQFTFAGLKSESVTGLPTWAHVFGINAYSDIDGFANIYEYAFCNGEMYIRNQYPLNEDTWGEWKQLATNNETIVKMGELTNSHNMNNVVKSGVYRIFGTTPANFVSGQTNGYFSVLVYENNLYTVQEATNFVTGQIYKRLINSNDGAIFKDWYEVATTTKTDILITYNQDYEPIDTNLNKIVKNSLGEVIIYFSVKRKDGGIFSVNNLFVVGAIPVGTRPISDMGFCVLGYETGISNFKPVGVSVYANGSVVIQTDSQVTAITGVIKYEAVR